MRLFPIRAALCLLAAAAPFATAHASVDAELVQSCRNVMTATEPARRIWLEQDLFAYELHRALGASGSELRRYRANLSETCSRVARNNRSRMRTPRAAPTWRSNS